MNEFENALELEEEKKCCCGGCAWKAVAMLFIGIVIGFLISPVKNGIITGNNNVTFSKTKKKCNCECEEK